MGRTLEVSELDLVGGVHGPAVPGELDLEEPSRFVPPDLGYEIESCTRCGETDDLGQADFFGDSIFVLQNHDTLAAMGEEFHGALGFVWHGLASPVLYLALSGVAVAWYLYLHKPGLAEKIRERLSAIHVVLINKYYFDEFYEKVIARLGTRVGTLLWRVGDVAVIDGTMVNGSARLVGWFSAVARQVQTGYLYTYAFAMIIGLSVLIGWFVFGP